MKGFEPIVARKLQSSVRREHATSNPVSYTHLDVYKRQVQDRIYSFFELQQVFEQAVVIITIFVHQGLHYLPIFLDEYDNSLAEILWNIFCLIF